MAIEAGVVQISVTPDFTVFTPQLIAGVTAAGNAAGKSLATTLTTMGRNLKTVGVGLTAAITAPIVAVGAGAITSAVNFETAFSQVRKTVDATEPEFGRLEQGIRDLAKTIPVSREELATLAGAAGQLGIQTDAILGFTEVAAAMGVATNVSAEDAATAMAQIANVMGTGQQDFDRMGSTIVDLGNKSAATESDIINMGQRISAAGAQAGLSEADVLGFASTISSLGIEVEAGGSSISRVFREMGVDVANGGEGLQQWADVAGMSADEFKQKFETDAAGATLAFVQGLDRIGESGGNVEQVLRDMGFGEMRVNRTITALVNNHQLLNDQLGIANGAWTNNNALQREADRAYNTTANQFVVLKNRVTDTALTVGKELLPAINDLIDAAEESLVPALEKAAKWFTDLSPEAQQFAVIAATVVAALGPVAFVVGQVATFFSGLIGVLKFLAPVFGPILSALTALWGAIQFVVGAIAILLGISSAVAVGIIVAVVAIVAAVIIFREEIAAAFRAAFEAVKRWLDMAGETISRWADNISGWFGRVVDTIAGWARSVVDTLAGWGNSVVSTVQGWGQGLLNFWNNLLTGIGNAWNTAWNALIGFLTPIFQGIQTFIQTAMTVIQFVITAVLAAVWMAWDLTFGAILGLVMQAFTWLNENVIGPALQWLQDAFMGAVEFVVGIWSAFWTELTTTLSGWFDAIMAVLTPAFQWVSDQFNAAMTWISENWNAFWNTITDFVEWAWFQIQMYVQIGMNTVQGYILLALNFINDVWDTAWEAISDFVSDTWNNITDAVDTAINNVQAVIEDVTSAISDTWDTVWGNISTFFTGIWEDIQGGARTAMGGLEGIFNGAVDIFRNIWNGIRNIFAEPVNWVIDNVINEFLGYMRRVANNLNFDIDIPDDLALLPTAHQGGVVGDPRMRRTPMGDLGPDERIIKARVGERVLTREQTAEWDTERETDVAETGDGLGDFLRDVLADALEAGRRLIANVARPAVNAILAGVDAATDPFGAPGDFAAGGAHRVGEGVLRWLDDADRAAADELARRVPQLGPGVGWEAMWNALKAALPFARLTSAFRPGSITATGNLSYHARGRAIDVAGPRHMDRPAMAQISRWVAENYGPQTLELIYSGPGGVNLWHGRPHRYTGVTFANHHDHVHWAMDNGGMLQPGWSAVYNGTGQPEVVAPDAKLEEVFERVLARAGGRAASPAISIGEYHAHEGTDVDALLTRAELRRLAGRL